MTLNQRYKVFQLDNFYIILIFNLPRFSHQFSREAAVGLNVLNVLSAFGAVVSVSNVGVDFYGSASLTRWNLIVRALPCAGPVHHLPISNKTINILLVKKIIENIPLKVF